jgi:hypothetical protein
MIDNDLINNINSYIISNKYVSRTEVSRHFNIGYKKLMKMHDEKLIKLNPAMSLKVASLMAKAVRKHNSLQRRKENG